jgi:hypothetical protein
VWNCTTLKLFTEVTTLHWLHVSSLIPWILGINIAVEVKPRCTAEQRVRRNCVKPQACRGDRSPALPLGSENLNFHVTLTKYLPLTLSCLTFETRCIIFPSTRRFKRQFLPFRIYNYNFISISHRLNVCYISCPSHLLWCIVCATDCVVK